MSRGVSHSYEAVTNTDDQLVEGCLPQRRVLDLAPILAKDDKAEQTDQLSSIIENSLRW